MYFVLAKKLFCHQKLHSQNFHPSQLPSFFFHNASTKSPTKNHNFLKLLQFWGFLVIQECFLAQAPQAFHIHVPHNQNSYILYRIWPLLPRLIRLSYFSSFPNTKAINWFLQTTGVHYTLHAGLKELSAQPPLSYVAADGEQQSILPAVSSAYLLGNPNSTQ